MDWAATLGSLSSALGVVKAIKDIDAAYDKAAYKAQIADLLSTLADVKIAVLDGREELREKDAEIQRLSNALATKADLIKGPGGYLWVNQGHGLRLGYPVCPKCLDSDGHQVELKQDGNKSSTKCVRCNTQFMPVEFFHDPDGNGQQQTEGERRAEVRRQQNERDTAAINRTRDWITY